VKSTGAGVVLATGVCLALLLAACEREEPELHPTATPPAATEEALRETAIAYERALARLDLETAYGFESADFRESCPYERYGELLLDPDFRSDCGYDETSEIDFAIENVEMGEDWGAVYGCYQDQNNRKCCLPDDELWDYKDGRWALTSSVPCAYALENERLLATLPELPGAQRVSTDLSFYSTEYESIPDRASLLVTYRPPLDKTTQDVIDFYAQSLGADWQLAVEEYPWEKGKVLVASFTRGKALVGVHTGSRSEGGLETLQVYVDQGGAKPTPVPLEPAERAERDARVSEILLESEFGRALFAGREERRDYWVVDIAHIEPLVHGEREAMVTIAFEEPVSYEGEIPTISDPCRGTRGDYVPDDPCHDAPWIYGTEYATFSSAQDFHFRIEIDRGELIEVFSAGSSPDIVDDMIEQAKRAAQE
jgi:hypothetical protein